MKKLRPAAVIGKTGKWTLLMLLAVFEVFPLIQLLFNSFRPDSEIKAHPLGLPVTWTLENYVDTWEAGGYAQAFLNSIWICLWTILITIVVISLAAYALAKINFKGREFFVAYFLFGMAIPSFAYLIPTYDLFNQMGLSNTHLSLIIVYSASNIPFKLLLLRTFLLGIPRELEESAKVDGCTELTAFLRITLPLAKSIIMTVMLLTILSCWNEFTFANTFVTRDSLRTVSTRFVKFTTEYNNNFARVFTSGVISIAPMVILYLLMQDSFIEGLTSGSVKG